ncbi:MAG: single-stranded DNA-binding protein [Myxococcota bacterium]
MNSVFLVGRLGADPELRRTGAGKGVCNLRVATERGGKEGKSQGPDWHRVVVWDRQAETCAQFLQKGRMVAVSGRLQHRTWETDKGEKRTSTEVVAYRVQFFSGGEAQSGPQGFSPAATQSLPF